MADPNATLNAARISFHTNVQGHDASSTSGFNKDHDTHVTATVRRRDGTVAARVSDNFGNFPENGDNGPFDLDLVEGGTLNDLRGSEVTIHIDPVGNDTWGFNYFLDLAFSDGSHLTSDANDIELTEEAQEQTFGIG